MPVGAVMKELVVQEKLVAQEKPVDQNKVLRDLERVQRLDQEKVRDVHLDKLVALGESVDQDQLEVLEELVD